MRYMNPIKEAKDLVSLFEYEDNLGIAENTGIEGIDKAKAKQCAILAVDKIIDFISWNVAPYSYDEDSMTRVNINLDHYIKVKQEIEKLNN
jgi:hypothetical protein